MTPKRTRTSTRVTDTADPTAFDMYVPPPGRGELQVSKGLRLPADLVDAMEELVNVKDAAGGKVYPFRNFSDVFRSSTYHGFMYLARLAKNGELDQIAAHYNSLLRMQSAADRMLKVRDLADKNDQNLKAMIDGDAKEEAQEYFRSQWNEADGGSDYLRRMIHGGLEKWKRKLFGDGQVVGLKKGKVKEPIYFGPAE